MGSSFLCCWIIKHSLLNKDVELFMLMICVSMFQVLQVRVPVPALRASRLSITMKQVKSTLKIEGPQISLTHLLPTWLENVPGEVRKLRRSGPMTTSRNRRSPWSRLKSGRRCWGSVSWRERRTGRSSSLKPGSNSWKLSWSWHSWRSRRNRKTRTSLSLKLKFNPYQHDLMIYHFENFKF